MIPSLVFSIAAALMVFLAGRGDRSRDPRLTVPALGLLALFPWLLLVLPKAAVLPPAAATVAAGGGGADWTAWLLVLWAAGVVIACLRLAMAAAVVGRWRRRSRQLAIVDGVAIRELPGLSSPVAAGVWRPVVFVPTAWSGWPESTRRIVLTHELAHHRRRDPLWRWVSALACAVHWYNPLVHWISRRLSLQCEFACDARVLRSGVAAGDYARLLCAIADERKHPGHLLAMAARSGLESRVRQLLGPVGRRRGPGGLGIALLVLGTVAIAGALASVAPRPAMPPQVTPQEAETRWSANPFPGES